MINKNEKQLQPLVAIIAAPFLSWNPSVLTVLSLVSSIVFFFGVIEHVYWLSIVSLVGFLFDVLDGYVARATKKVTKFGGFLDSTLDRVSDFCLFTCFGFAHMVQWEFVVLVLFSSVLISYMRSRGDLAFGLGHADVEGLMQRPQRIVMLLLGFFLFFLFPHLEVFHLSLLTMVFVLIFLLNCITILQRFFAFARM